MFVGLTAPHGGYTTNLPPDDLLDGRAWIAYGPRMTHEDEPGFWEAAGYSAQRSYSIASAPAGSLVELTVQRLADGGVSPYLTDVVEPGDQIELRGPIGG